MEIVVAQFGHDRGRPYLQFLRSIVIDARDQVGQRLGPARPSIVGNSQFGESTVRVGPNGDTVEVGVAVDLGHGLLQSTNFRTEFFAGQGLFLLLSTDVVLSQISCCYQANPGTPVAQGADSRWRTHHEGPLRLCPDIAIVPTGRIGQTLTWTDPCR